MGFRTHDRWLNVVEAFQELEPAAKKAKEHRASSALGNARKLFSAQFQVLQQLGVGNATYLMLHDASQLSESSTHKAVMALLKTQANKKRKIRRRLSLAPILSRDLRPNNEGGQNGNFETTR